MLWACSPGSVATSSPTGQSDDGKEPELGEEAQLHRAEGRAHADAGIGENASSACCQLALGSQACQWGNEQLGLLLVIVLVGACISRALQHPRQLRKPWPENAFCGKLANAVACS